MQSSGGDWAGQAFTHCYVPKAWSNYLVSCLWRIIANRKQFYHAFYMGHLKHCLRSATNN